MDTSMSTSKSAPRQPVKLTLRPRPARPILKSAVVVHGPPAVPTTNNVVISYLFSKMKSKCSPAVLERFPMYRNFKGTMLCNEIVKFDKLIISNMSHSLVIERIVDLLEEKLPNSEQIQELGDGGREGVFKLYKRIMKHFFWTETLFEWNSILLTLVTTQRLLSRLIDPSISRQFEELSFFSILESCIRFLDEPWIQLPIRDLGGWSAVAINYEHLAAADAASRAAEPLVKKRISVRFGTSSYNVNQRLQDARYTFDFSHI